MTSLPEVGSRRLAAHGPCDERSVHPTEESPIHMLPKGISVVVPVYNSQLSLPKLIDRLEPVLRQSGEWFEVILVNDGSVDRSWSEIVRLARSHSWVRGIDLMRNRGQENALLCGVRAATYDVTVTIDDDLQNPPEEIPRVLAKLAEGYDVVYGVARFERHGFLRNFASVLTKSLLRRAMGAETARNLTAFKAFKTQLRQCFLRYQSPWVSLDVLLSWGTRNFGLVSVRQDAREVGTSNYTFAKLAAHAMTLMVGFSNFPLHLATLVGIFLCLGGIATTAIVTITGCIGGWRIGPAGAMVAALTIFSGVQLTAIGIVGEYIARIHMRATDREPYNVRAQTKSNEDVAIAPSEDGSAGGGASCVPANALP